MGNGCGSVGWGVTSKTRKPRFRSRQLKTFIWNIYLYSQLYWKDENKEKRWWEWTIFKLESSSPFQSWNDHAKHDTFAAMVRHCSKRKHFFHYYSCLLNGRQSNCRPMGCGDGQVVSAIDLWLKGLWFVLHNLLKWLFFILKLP